MSSTKAGMGRRPLLRVSLAVMLLSLLGTATAQQADSPPPAQPDAAEPPAAEATEPADGSSPADAVAQAGDGIEEVVVTGFRGSLNAALMEKRETIGAVDAIVAEDIADFPDNNLAESIQRIPGISIARDGGEGRQISVRGLGPQFTRIRINGMEALSSTGSTDASGGTNRNRSFDFNVFASELFNSITVRKTASAEVEEGSLGATVDLQVARPFDYKGLTVVAGGQAGYNDLSEDWNPRGTFLVSNTFLDGKLGALLSVAYTDRSLLDEGSSAVRWQNGGAFGSVAEGVPYTGAELANAFRPRIPRYDVYEHEQERLGMTTSLQFQPSDGTLFTLDGLYAKFDATRTEMFLQAPNFSSSLAQVDVLDAVIEPNGSTPGTGTLVYGLFDDVDIRSEQRYDELTTEFKQLTLNGSHELTDKLRLNGLVGWASSEFDNPIQTTLLWDIADVDGYSYDYRGDSRLPMISYGNADITNPEAWTLSQIRLRPQGVENVFKNYALDLAWDATDVVTLKVGMQFKQYEFEAFERRRASEGSVADQAGTARSLYSRWVTLSDLDVPGGTASGWVVPDVQAAADLFGLYDETLFPLTTTPALANNFSVDEEDTGGFALAEFKTELFGRRLNGNVGVRRVHTKQTSTGYATTSTGPQLLSVDHSFDDTLPSLNLSMEVAPDFLIRFGAAKVMARAGLGDLSPGGTVSITGNNKVVATGNPTLDPFRATTFDLGFEWYFASESLLGLALFYKDIDSFVQTVRATGEFSENPLGLSDSVAIAQCDAAPGEFDPENPADVSTCLSDWQFNIPRNGPGGKLKGFELSYQQPFSFLPSPFNDFGTQLNYTYVTSDIDYLNADGSFATSDSLAGLSENAANATLYFDNGTLSARISMAYRDEFLTTVPGRNGNNVEGTADTINLDFSSSYAYDEHLSFTLEALNLTDEFNDQWVDSNADRSSFYHHTGRQLFVGVRYRM